MIFPELKRILKAFTYSWDGLTAAFGSEPAFRQEVFLAIIAIPLALFFDVSSGNKALMICSIFLILIAELANSAIEAVIDRISLDKHDLSKRAKDIGSSMVLIAFVNAACVWGIILLG